MRVSDKWVKDYSTGEGWDPVTKELALDLGEARAELAEAKSVNAAIGYAESQNNARMLAAEACIRELEAELNEQARVNGMGGSREAALLAKVARLKAALREAMEWNWIEDASLDGGIPESVVKQCNDALGASELETGVAKLGHSCRDGWKDGEMKDCPTCTACDHEFVQVSGMLQCFKCSFTKPKG